MIRQWFIDLPTRWTLVELDKPLESEMAAKWVFENGKWQHRQYRKSSHNELGMAYAWWYKHINPDIIDFQLSDSPDFYGLMKVSSNYKCAIYGDIGRCTPNAIINAMQSFDIHDLWITIFDWSRHVIVDLIIHHLCLF